MSRRTNDVTDEQIVEAYRELKSGQSVADRLGVCTPTVYSVLRTHGVDRTAYLNQIRKGVSEDEIISAYRELKSLHHVTKRLGVSWKRIDKTLRRRGVERYGHEISKLDRRGLSPEEEVKACSAFVDDGEQAVTIARRLKVSAGIVRETLRRAGINPVRKSHLSKGERERAFELYQKGLGMREIGKEIGRTEATIRRFLHLDHPETVRPRVRRGRDNHAWKGGRTIDKQGYAYLRVDRDDPLAVAMGTKQDVVAEHRLVLARSLGRPLTSGETVHHINGYKLDNRLENLQLRNGRHGKGKMLCCADCGSRNIVERALD